jgi:hypothetical protein
MFLIFVFFAFSMDEVERLKNSDVCGIALDIDETLAWTIGLWVERLIRDFGNPENLSVKDIAEKYKLFQNIPYWKDEVHWDFTRSFIESNDFQEDIPLIENCNDLVNEINKEIPVVAYITARPEMVGEGTLKWLKKHGFPDAPLILRPNNISNKDGSRWKAKVLEDLYPRVIGIIDDNPGFFEFLSPKYKGTIFLYKHSERFRDDLDVVACPKWSDVSREVLMWTGLLGNMNIKK